MIQISNEEGSLISVKDVLIQRDGKPTAPGVQFVTNGTDNTLDYAGVVHLTQALQKWIDRNREVRQA